VLELTIEVGPNDLHTVIELPPRPLQRYPPVCHHVRRLQTLRTAPGRRDRLFKGMGDSDGGCEGRKLKYRPSTPSRHPGRQRPDHIRTGCHPVRQAERLARVHRNQRRREQRISTSAEGWAQKNKRAGVRLPWSVTWSVT